MLNRVFIAIGSIALTACALQDGLDDSFYILNYTADFRQSLDKWEDDFADYPAAEGDSIKYGLQAGLINLPSSVGVSGTGLMMSGSNQGDGLFMFIRRKVSGLKPDTEYTIVFDVELASNAPTGNYSGNGSPGESVYLKVGAVNKKPEKTIVNGYYRMNIDKGSPSDSGTDMIVIGNIGVTTSTTTYSIIARSNSTNNARITCRTNSAGDLWLIAGTDSGFTGTTTLYYTKIDVIFSTNG